MNLLHTLLPLAALVALPTQCLLLPPPPGPSPVLTQPSILLVDPSRNDPLAPQPNTPRRILASLHIPLAPSSCRTNVSEPYMPPLTAKVFGQLGKTLGVPEGTLEKFNYSNCVAQPAPNSYGEKPKGREFPTVILDPGLGGTRLIYAAMARSIASYGIVVWTLDHTYETLVTEFPDGEVAYANASALDTSKDETLVENVEIRTGDITYLISQLSNQTFTAPLLTPLAGYINPSKIVVTGHSLGGATAATTTQRSPRVPGGINFDGTIFGPVRHQGFTHKPFLLVGTERYRDPNNPNPLNNNSDPSWREFYPRVREADKMVLGVKKTQHYAFTDVPILLDVDPVPKENQAMVDATFGTLGGKRVERVVDDVVRAFVELIFEGKKEGLKSIGKNPDVDVVRSNLERKTR